MNTHNFDYHYDNKQGPNTRTSNKVIDDNLEEIPIKNKNPYDGVQINGQAGKRFEYLLTEELKPIPNAFPESTKQKGPNSNHQFLRKGSRTHLSSAAQRAPIILDESSQKQDSEAMAFATTKPPSKGPKSLQIKQHQKPLKDTGDAGNFFPRNTEKVSGKPKEQKKFLTRGGGTGGGIGNAGPPKTRMSIKENPEERHEEERVKSSHTRSRNDDKKSEDYNEKPLKTNKTQGNFGETKPKLSHNYESSYNDDQNFEKGYRFEKCNRQESPKCNFDIDSAHNIENKENIPQAANFWGEAPVSNLVNQYFYKKKPAASKEKEPEKNEEEENMKKFANEKIEILNSEMAKFKLEKERVKKMRQKCDEILKALNKDIADWEKQKEKEQREFEEWQQEEMRKIKHEKKLAEKYQKTVSNNPSRKEREEIDTLNNQIAKLAEELQTKDRRSKFTADRLKRQIEEAEQLNSEVMEDIRILRNQTLF